MDFAKLFKLVLILALMGYAVYDITIGEKLNAILNIAIVILIEVIEIGNKLSEVE